MTGIDQIDAMRMGVDYSFTIQCRQFAMVCRPLSMSETVEVANRVNQRLSRVPEHGKHRLTEHTFLAFETLCMASTSGVGKNDPHMTEYILERCTPEELQFLMKQYTEGCEKVNPCLEMLSPEKLKELVETVKKSPSEEWVYQLIALSFTDRLSLSLALIQAESQLDK